MTGYAKARRDFEYLESVTHLSDQVELDGEREALMQNPTKEKAADMYISGICLWFQEHRENFDDDRKVAAIRKHYDNEGYSL